MMAQVHEADILQLTRHADAHVRKQAVQQLCPCHLKADYEPVWDRLLEMVDDHDVKVRGHVLHALCDGSPRSREGQVVAALEAMRNDPDQGLRRRVRQTLAQYRRTGRVNIL